MSLLVLDLVWLLLPVAAGSGWFFARRSRRFSSTESPDESLRSHYFKSINYLLNEQPDKAIEVFIKVLEVDKETVETHLALGNLYRRRGEVDRAIRIHQNLIARSSLSEEQRLESLLELGQDYLSAGLLDRAEDLFQELAETTVYRVQALRQLIDIYEQEKDWEKAITSSRKLEKATGNQLGDVIAHYYCEEAERCRQSGDLPRALKLTKQALYTHKDCVRASVLEGDIGMQTGDYSNALRALQRVEEQDPDHLPEIVPRVHECFIQLKNPQKMSDYLNGLNERYGWVTTTLALTDMTLANVGTREAIDFLTAQLKQRTSVRGLDRLLELELSDSRANKGEHLEILKDLTSRLLENRPVYKCQHCGFPAKSLHWQCPSCKHWNAIKPIQGVEGE